MATYRIEDTTLQGIADKIRSKTGKTGAIPVTSFESEIDGIASAPEFDGNDVPETMGQAACLARAAQFRDIKYTPVAPLPYGGTESLPANVEVTGLPYSSTRITDKFIGFNVSLHTFMTALHNPKSVLYTKRVEGISNASTWYGTNCSTYVSYALDLPYHSATNIIPLLPGMNEITDYTDLKLCDVVNCHPNFGNGTVNHSTMITGITRNADGSIETVTVSESLGNQKIISTTFTYDEWYRSYIVNQRYKVYRYKKLYEASYQYSEYVHSLNGDDVTDPVTYSDLCTNLGDKATIRTDESITLNPLVTNGYTAIELYKDGELLDTYDAKDVELSGLSAGKYTAVMTPSTGISSTHFIVCEVSASKNGSKVKFSGVGAIPARIVFKDAKGITKEVAELTEDDILNGYKEVHPTNTDITSVCVPFKNEYGFVTVTSELDVNTIPDEYELLEYIQTDGNQHIDTGVNASDYPDGLVYTASFEFTGVAGKTHYLWGALSNGIRAGNFAWIYNSDDPANSTTTLYIGDNSSGIPKYADLMNVKSTVVAKARGNGGYAEYKLNGETVGATVNSTSIAPDETIALFWCNGLSATSSSKKFIGKLDSYQIETHGGKKIRDYSPVRHKSTGALGFYDTVTKTLFTNAGTGSFVAGPAV